MKKIDKSDDNVVDLILGSLIISILDFNGEMLLEKIFVLLGFVILIVGIVRTIMKYKGQNKKGLLIFLIIMGLIAFITFLGLLYRLIFA